MKRLHPNAVWLFFLQYSIGTFFFFFFFGLCFIPSFITGFFEDSAASVFSGIAAIGIFVFCIIFILLLGLSYAFARLAYNNYWYELKEDGFYKESGVITKKYVTIPYERIQNVDINRGLIARMLGLSDLQIQTAGMSASFGRYGAYGVGAEGRLPGVSEHDAKEIRDEVVKRAKGHKSGV